MYKQAVGDVVESLEYPFRDISMIILIGLLLFFINFINELPIVNTAPQIVIFIVTECLLFLELGYGSKIVYSSLKGLKNPPKFNKPQKLFIEGFKKTCIYFVYGIFLSYAVSRFRHYLNIDLGLCIFWALIFIFVYITMIGGLLNRYEYQGSFIQAFNLKKAYSLLSQMGPRALISIFVCAQVAQLFVANVFIDTIDPFSLFGLFFLILQFMVSPFALFATKRMISLNLLEMYGDN